METFLEFKDKRDREAKKHLKILKKLLESQGMKCEDYLGEDDPYIFVYNPGANVTFDGIRLYQIGSQIAYRIQKESKTHPFGLSYSIPIEEMFDDLMSDNHKPDVAGKKVIESVAEEIKQFFIKSAEAEADLKSTEMGTSNDPMNKIVLRSGGGTDYANLTYTKS